MVRMGFRHTRCQRKGGQGPGKGLGAAALGSGSGGILFWERAAEPVPKGKGPAEGQKTKAQQEHAQTFHLPAHLLMARRSGQGGVCVPGGCF